VKHWLAMKIMWKKLMFCTLVLATAAPAYAKNQTLTCWYSGNADFTSADPAEASAQIGAVARAGSGNKTYSYIISARDGSACPVQLPLSSLTAITVPLILQDEGSCSNEEVKDSDSATVGGSVTIARETEATSTAGIRLVGVKPNTRYRISLKCGRQLGTLRTDDDGNAGRTVDFPNPQPGQAYSFEVAPEEQPEGNKLQSLSLKK